MSDQINLLKRVSSLDKSPLFDSYSKVVIHIDDETEATVGDDYGRTFEITNPFGSQAMATQLLAKLRRFQYQPYKATGAQLDPAAEIGDAVSINNLYGGIYTRERVFSRLMRADISAPHDEEINHEYNYSSPAERMVRRRLGDVKASLQVQANRITAEVEDRTEQDSILQSALNVQADQISAKVSQSGGDASTFGWSLTATGFYLSSGGTTVFSVDSSGATVTGTIKATSGKIGGFTIGSNAIYNNISEFGGTQNKGVYLGKDGIQLGKKFKVDSSGDLTASSGKFTGNVYAKKILYGQGDGYNAGTFNGGGLEEGSVGKGRMTTGVQGTLNQVGVNKSNIEAIQGYFTGSAHFSSLTAENYWLDGKVLYFDESNYVRGRSYD